MLKEFIDRIAELSIPTVQEIAGLPHSDRKMQPIMPPMVESVKLSTLQGLVDAIKANMNGLSTEPCLVHVKEYSLVQVVAKKPDAWGRRVVHLEAESDAFPDSAFRFGQYVDQETFIIALHSRFVDGPAKTELLGLVSRLTSELVGVSEDNGVSQNVTLRKGVALKENRDINPRVTLKPYRTFVEVEQPSSDFIFRVRSNGPDQKPSCGLFEADGGRWKIEAMQNIKQWLDGKTAGFPIIT